MASGRQSAALDRTLRTWPDHATIIPPRYLPRNSGGESNDEETPPRNLSTGSRLVLNFIRTEQACVQWIKRCERGSIPLTGSRAQEEWQDSFSFPATAPWRSGSTCSFFQQDSPAPSLPEDHLGRKLVVPFRGICPEFQIGIQLQKPAWFNQAFRRKAIMWRLRAT